MSEEILSKNAGSDEKQMFWESVQESFRQTREMIEYIAYEQGIDLDKIEPDPEFEQKEKESKEKAEDHELSRTSMQYTKKVHKWFIAAEPVLLELEQELNNNLKLGIKTSETQGAAIMIEDAISVIRWYQHLIYTKLMRALTSHDDLFEDMDLGDEFPSDADGSAKVALLAIDRSIAAWGKLYEQMPTQADEILDFLVLLEQLRRNAEKCFPKARAFIRPGFDTGHRP
ncbi:MAG: hypothetical protein WD334_12585 [Chitinophagales bacterium]